MPAAFRTLLGREFHHAVFDARSGFHAEAFAALAGTLTAGSWLLLLVPPWRQWPQQPDADSLRWADVSEPIATPHFIRHLQRLIEQDAQGLLLRQPSPLNVPDWPALPEWHSQATVQQQTILCQLNGLSAGVAVLTAARGRGKSALAGMLARQNTRCLITAPAKVATGVLSAFAGEHYRFMAPDAILALETVPDVDWLIVDEVAAIPAPLLHALVARFRRVLLVTTIQGYEGSGRGFMLKFCAELEQVRHFTLDEPLRWARNDPLENWLNQALLFEETPDMPPASGWSASGGTHGYARLTGGLSAAYQRSLSHLAAGFTPPAGCARYAPVAGGHCPGIAGRALAGGRGRTERGVSSGSMGGPQTAARQSGGAVTGGPCRFHRRRHAAGFTYQPDCRGTPRTPSGTGRQLVTAACAAATGYDYISVSFGYTEALWAFWRACGFTLARIGSQREASSGCYAAMALLGLTSSGRQLQQKAAQQLARDWSFLSAHIPLALPLSAADDCAFTLFDARLAAGFAWHNARLKQVWRCSSVWSLSARLRYAFSGRPSGPTPICPGWRRPRS